MLHLNQPIGTGFSYGNYAVTSTVTAAPYVWKLLQAFIPSFRGTKTRISVSSPIGKTSPRGFPCKTRTDVIKLRRA